MGISIKNMEMPNTCNDCPLSEHYFTNYAKVRCFINAELRDTYMESRPSWCPLVEDSHWHTGTPPVEGLYVVAYANGEHKLCEVRYTSDGDLGGWFHFYEAIAYMQIKPFEARTI